MAGTPQIQFKCEECGKNTSIPSKLAKKMGYVPNLCGKCRKEQWRHKTNHGKMLEHKHESYY